jgi:hypothetical protein
VIIVMSEAFSLRMDRTSEFGFERPDSIRAQPASQ